MVLMVGMILINVCQKRIIHEQMTNANARRVELRTIAILIFSKCLIVTI